jgi:hypothetical protein
MALIIGFAVTIVVCGGYWAVVSSFPDHRGEFHSAIAGVVAAGAVALSAAPWWLVLATFLGTTWLFVRWSHATHAQEQQELLAWRQEAIVELGMRNPTTPYHPPALTRTHTLVEGAVGGAYVIILRDISGSDVGPDAWYAVELRVAQRTRYENLYDKLTRGQVFAEVKRLLAAFQNDQVPPQPLT